MNTINQSASDLIEVAEEATENQVESVGIPTANSTEDQPNENHNSQDAGTSSGSGVTTTENRAPTKRNYRRRTESGGESSNDADIDTPVEDQAAVSESEDVSLDELRVSGSEEANNQSPRR